MRQSARDAARHAAPLFRSGALDGLDVLSGFIYPLARSFA
jgi:hypothetical protein